MNETIRQELLKLAPDSDPITWSRPTTCDGKGWVFEGEPCGHRVRLYYIGRAPGRKWLCPICGCGFPFAFWEIKADRDFKPTPEQEADIRAMWRDGRKLAEGMTDGYEYAAERDALIRLHAITAGPVQS